MAKHDFAHLFHQYPAIIAVMKKKRFTSHEFILQLAQRNQKLYIAALNEYRRSSAPFQRVHSMLSKQLYKYPKLVKHVGNVPSRDIFGDPANCAEWEKL